MDPIRVARIALPSLTVTNIEMAHQDWIDAQASDESFLCIPCPDEVSTGWTWDHLLNDFVPPSEQ